MLRSNGRSVPFSVACVRQRCHNSSTGASRKTVGTAGCFQQSRIFLLHEGAPAQGNDSCAPAAQFLDHMLQGRVLGSPELGFPRIPENLRHGAPFAGLNAVVEIFKDPIQPLPEGASYARFPGSHKADQENRVAGKPGELRGRPSAPHTYASLGVRGFARTLLQVSF